MNRGIDYGRGLTNIDHNTGIRYGILPASELYNYGDELLEPIYSPHCPSCGEELSDDWRDNAEDCDPPSYAVRDYYPGAWVACPHCDQPIGDGDEYGDEPDEWKFTDDSYQGFMDESGDVWFLRSPYYTKAAFCSPCAPGACYLLSHCEEGERAYCPSPNDFDESYSPCPFPVWTVDGDELIYTPNDKED